MIIICPSCMARYRLEGELGGLPPAGRSMRCGRCGNTWQATPVEPPPEILPPVLYDHGAATPEPEDGPAADEPPPMQAQRIDDDSDDALADGAEAAGRFGPDAAEAPLWRAHRRASRAATATRRSRGASARHRGRAVMLGMLVAASIAALHYREDVVRAVPASAGLYERIGLPVNLRGLEIRDVVARREFEDGLPVLIVEGEVVNLRQETTDVPALRIAVRGGQGEELYVWRIDPRQRELAPAESLTLRSRLAVPPAGARDVELRFVERAQRSAASLGMR